MSTPPASSQSQLSELSAAWLSMYHRLVDYQRKHGDCRVHSNDPDTTLANWVKTQRFCLRHAPLTSDKRQLLDALGFCWGRETKGNDVTWHRMYQRLQAFQREFGHCRVPQRYKPDRPLGEWVQRNRFLKSTGGLTQDRVQQLNDIGFIWNATKTDLPNFKEVKWIRQYNALVEYYQEHGDCNVPLEYGSLGPWVQHQSRLYGLLPLDHRHKVLLDKIHFVPKIKLVTPVETDMLSDAEVTSDAMAIDALLALQSDYSKAQDSVRRTDKENATMLPISRPLSQRTSHGAEPTAPAPDQPDYQVSKQFETSTSARPFWRSPRGAFRRWPVNRT